METVPAVYKWNQWPSVQFLSALKVTGDLACIPRSGSSPPIRRCSENRRARPSLESERTPSFALAFARGGAIAPQRRSTEPHIHVTNPPARPLQVDTIPVGVEAYDSSGYFGSPSSLEQCGEEGGGQPLLFIPTDEDRRPRLTLLDRFRVLPFALPCYTPTNHPGG